MSEMIRRMSGFVIFCLFVPLLSAQEKPRNIILLIGDGMGFAQIQTAYFENGRYLAMLGMPITGAQHTESASHRITDSGAAATAIATGVKTYNKAIGVDTLGMPLVSIIESAEKKGLSTGLVCTSSLTHATPAAFAAHCRSRNDYEAIARDLSKSGIDFLAGGGYKYFHKRTDGIDLAEQMRAAGYTVHLPADTMETVNGLPLIHFAADKHLPPSGDRDGFLLQFTNKALEALSKDEDGFFIMIEGSQIDWGGHMNSGTYLVKELLDFDKAVEAALAFARVDGNTLVIVTADHETGGMSLIRSCRNKNKLTSRFSTFRHSAVMVPVFAFGPGSELFTGVYQNTELHTKMMLLLGLR